MFVPVSLALAAAPPPPVGVAIVAPAEVSAGAPMAVAVVLTVPDGWHIYWENPGQSGLATDVRLSARSADGAPLPVAGPAWPTPTRFVADGLTNYGYGGAGPEGAPAFAFTIQTAPGPLTLRADVSWLSCRDVCVPGTATATATVGTRATPPERAIPDPVAPLLARLPAPFAASGGTVSLTDGRLRVVVPGPGPFDVFPSVALEGVWAPEQSTGPDGSLVLESPLPAVPAGSHVVVTRGAGPTRVGFTLDLPESSP